MELVSISGDGSLPPPGSGLLLCVPRGTDPAPCERFLREMGYPVLGKWGHLNFDKLVKFLVREGKMHCVMLPGWRECPGCRLVESVVGKAWEIR